MQIHFSVAIMGAWKLTEVTLWSDTPYIIHVVVIEDGSSELIATHLDPYKYMYSTFISEFWWGG